MGVMDALSRRRSRHFLGDVPMILAVAVLPSSGQDRACAKASRVVFVLRKNGFLVDGGDFGRFGIVIG